MTLGTQILALLGLVCSNVRQRAREWRAIHKAHRFQRLFNVPD